MADSAHTDPFEQRHQQYDAQYEAIGAVYDPKDGTETDWKSLALLVEGALSDPALPRLHRAELRRQPRQGLRDPRGGPPRRRGHR